MNILYVCNHIEKLVEVDDYEKGLTDKPQTIIFDKINITAETLKELLEKIGKTYCLDFAEGVGLHDTDDHSQILVEYNRLEDVEGYEATDSEVEDWKSGKTTLYLADYSFCIEKYAVLNISREDFERESIKLYS